MVQRMLYPVSRIAMKGIIYLLRQGTT